MRFLLQRMTTADRLVTAGLLLLALMGIALNLSAPPGSRVVAGDGERVFFTTPLDQPREVDLPGPLGLTRLVVADDGARIAASPCGQKVCMGMGPARRPGDLLVCLPNRVLVRIEGAAPARPDYDLLSR